MYISLRAAIERDKHNTMIPDIQSLFHNIRIASSILTRLLEKQTKNHQQSNYSLPLSTRIMKFAAMKAYYYV